MVIFRRVVHVSFLSLLEPTLSHIYNNTGEYDENYKTDLIPTTLFPNVQMLSNTHATSLPYVYAAVQYRRLRGIRREIGFGFVSCSCRACVYAGVCDGEISCSCGGSGTDLLFACLLLYTRVLRKIMPICYYTQGF